MDRDEFSPEELRFMARHEIDRWDVYDARGASVASQKPRMKEQGLYFCVADPCRNSGHRLKTRNGHCIQCDPSKIAFQKRGDSDAHVYLSWSYVARLAKIGVSKSPQRRIEQHNRGMLGGATDWQLLRSFQTNNAGYHEQRLIERLHPYLREVRYVHDGETFERVSKETFACELSYAQEVYDNYFKELSAQTSADDGRLRFKENVDIRKLLEDMLGDPFD